MIRPFAVRLLVLASSLLVLCVSGANADATPQALPFAQSWTNTGLITVNDSWSGVPGIEGFRGDGLTASDGVDPQTVLAGNDPGVLDVNANQTDPNVFGTGGVTEFHLADPVVALAGSGTADAPYLRVRIVTTGSSGIRVRYTLRDVDGSADNATQPVALHYRVGTSGSFTNVAAGYVADATTGGTATQTTAVCAVLPAAADNQAEVQVRVMTTNAAGNDEWVGIDDLQIDTGVCPTLLTVNDVSLAEGDAGTTSFQFTVSLSAAAGVGGVGFDIATADGTAQDDVPNTEDEDYVANSLTGQTIPEGQTQFQFSVQVNGDTEVESNETFFVNVTNVTGATAADGQGQGTIQNDDVALTLIHVIQGSGASSPIPGASVTVRGIVTGVRSNGFFLQEEEADYDADPMTSEGIVVFTSTAPPAAAAVGNLVQVTGTVTEFVPSQDPLQPPLTELTSPTVLQLSSGNPLPAPIPLTMTFPDPTGAHAQLERLEGMRVSVASLTVVGPTLGNTNEPTATATSTGVFYGVVTGIARPFREAGIPAPDPAPSGGGSIPPIPRFDSNPERIRVDSDGLVGSAAIEVGAGATVANVVGPLDYTFRTYSISPDPAAATPAGAPTPTAVSTPATGELTVASYNLERFFDDVDDPGIGEPVLTPAAYANRLKKASLQIRDYLKTPDIVGVVEVENLATLIDLAGQITTDAIADGDPDPDYLAYLVAGNDVGGIDVGFLAKGLLVDNKVRRVQVLEVDQENAGELFTNPDASTELLNDRPPLVLRAIVHHESGESFPVTVIVNHLRSLNGANSESPGSNGWATGGARVRAKRQKQAESLANLVQARQVDNPEEHLVVLGDFNFFEVNDGLTHGMGVVTGAPVPDDETAVPGDGVDLVTPNLTRLTDAVATERYSFIFDGNAQSLDHLLINEALLEATPARRVEHPRVNADYPETDRNDYTAGNPRRLADHDPLVAFFTVETFANTIFLDDFESQGTQRWSATVP